MTTVHCMSEAKPSDFILINYNLILIMESQVDLWSSVQGETVDIISSEPSECPRGITGVIWLVGL